ncbi:MAG: succinate dehydrogenase cytochrome b subunit [Deltaproteobacteria bacterium]|nr:succinate dehydrogenase cytochrome b subunit [Deltaproteobacteria bacterium]
MGWLSKFLNSNIGLKVLMALSGMMMLGFVVVHMTGNLQVFLGAHALDRYGSFLQNIGELLWVARLGLVSALTIHVLSATILTLRSWGARPVAYRSKYWFAPSLLSRTMLYGGVAIGLFLVLHLLHLSPSIFGLDHGIAAITPGYEHCKTVGDGLSASLECGVYANVVHGFSVVWVSALYIVAMIFLGMHIGHGAWSMFRTLGLDNPRYDRLAQGAAVSIGALVAVGNSLIPISVLVGLVHL